MTSAHRTFMVPLEAFSLSCSPAGDAAADRKEQLQRQAGCAAARHFRRSCLTCRMPASKPKGILQDQLLEAQKSHKIGRLQITVSGVAEAEAAAAFFQVAMLCSVVIACRVQGLKDGLCLRQVFLALMTRCHHCRRRRS